jgi:hypothetical protein
MWFSQSFLWFIARECRKPLHIEAKTAMYMAVNEHRLVYYMIDNQSIAYAEHTFSENVEGLFKMNATYKTHIFNTVRNWYLSEDELGSRHVIDVLQI